MSKLKRYKITIQGGYISLITAESLEQARDKAYYEQGHNNVKHVVLSTKEDLEWVQAMGGYVPPIH